MKVGLGDIRKIPEEVPQKIIVVHLGCHCFTKIGPSPWGAAVVLLENCYILALTAEFQNLYQTLRNIGKFEPKIT